MTSQVAAMSLYGAAVASDTIVTVSSGRNQKVIPNSSKIIELGPKHRVLVLNSGNLKLNDFPHDLHVHEWAKTLPGPLSTLTEYVRSYKAWAASERRLSTPQSQLNLITSIVDAELQDMELVIQGHRDSNLIETDFNENLRAVDRIDRMAISDFAKKEIFPLPDFPDLDRSILQDQLKSAGIDLLKRTQDYFSNFVPRIAPSNLKIVGEAVSQLIGKSYRREADSELGFIGMGSDQSFVGAIRVRCAGIFAGGLQSSEVAYPIEPSGGHSRLVYFGQHKALQGTISGIHPEMLNSSKGIFEDILSTQLNQDPDSVARYSEIFIERVEGVSEADFVQPMFSTMSAYSIPELSAFADTLVSSQAFSNIFEDRQSTVGGLIEVASIDPREGVVWHRRLPRSKLFGMTVS